MPHHSQFDLNTLVCSIHVELFVFIQYSFVVQFIKGNCFHVLAQSFSHSKYFCSCFLYLSHQKVGVFC